MNRKTLILTNKDIRKLSDLKKSFGAVEKAFQAYGKSQVQMPSKVYLSLDKHNGDFRAMPAYVESLNSAAIKWVNVHPDNVNKGLPTVMATMILSDPKTGYPLCIMDGTLLTSLRTAAAGGVAAKYLAREDSSILALVGCGEQAKTQLEMLRLLFPIKEVRVWGHKQSLSQKFVKNMKSGKENMQSMKLVKDCVNDADIIVTTTPSSKSLVKLAWLKEGVHINAIGADAKGKIELEPQVLKKARLVIDDWEQASHSGEINVALAKKIISKRDVYSSLSDIVVKRKKGRTNSSQITVFDSTGLAIQDVAVGDMLYKLAKRKKVGKFIQLI